MIVAKTALKKIPEKCTYCKFKKFRFPIVHPKASESDTECDLTGKALFKTFDKKLNNWVFYRPKWCPLMEIE